MRVTFPHMGNIDLAITAVFEHLGIEVVPPPKTNKNTFQLGSKHAPECACLPFKINVGNYLQAIEQGADTIIMLGGSGPCRFGYYGAVQREILRDLGFKGRMIILDGSTMKKEIDNIRREAGVTWWQVVQAVRLGFAKLKAADLLEAELFWARAAEKRPGMAEKIYRQSLEKLARARHAAAVRKISINARQKIKACREDRTAGTKRESARRNRLRIGIIGDIYMMTEPAVNLQLEKFLGDRGVEVERSLCLSRWLMDNVFPLARRKHRREMLQKAAPYILDFVGGHGLESIAHTRCFAERGFDGVIQVLPMTCAPEIVAASILPKASRELGIPVLTIVLDEHAGEAGLHTRLEAFLDLLEKGQQRNEPACRPVEIISKEVL